MNTSLHAVARTLATLAIILAASWLLVQMPRVVDADENMIVTAHAYELDFVTTQDRPLSRWLDNLYCQIFAYVHRAQQDMNEQAPQTQLVDMDQPMPASGLRSLRQEDSPKMSRVTPP